MDEASLFSDSPSLVLTFCRTKCVRNVRQKNEGHLRSGKQDSYSENEAKNPRKYIEMLHLVVHQVTAQVKHNLSITFCQNTIASRNTAHRLIIKSHQETTSHQKPTEYQPQNPRRDDVIYLYKTPSYLVQLLYRIS